MTLPRGHSLSHSLKTQRACHDLTLGKLNYFIVLKHQLPFEPNGVAFLSQRVMVRTMELLRPEPLQNSSVNIAVRCSVTTVLLCVYVSVHRDVWKHVSKMLITLISRELASLVICTVFFCTFLYRLIFTLHGNDFYKNSNAIFYTPSQPTHKGTPWTDYSNSTNRTGDTSEVPGKREGQARESERPGVSPGV